ncbi:MAG: hypothetical protein L0H59_01220 [Tomitella sp.]|nr:hypothetical protein [Tomitella sp.]
MTIWETLLIYLGGPLLITAFMAIFGLVSRTPKAKHYTLGEEWTEGPVWWGAVDEAPWHRHGGEKAIGAGVSGGAASGNW